MYIIDFDINRFYVPHTYPAVTLKVLLEDAQNLTRLRLPLGNISIDLRDISGRRLKDLQLATLKFLLTVKGCHGSWTQTDVLFRDRSD